MKNLKNRDINNIQNNNLIQGGVVMKSNLITRMITLCMCMVVVGFASEKQHLTEQQLQNPISINIMDDKNTDYGKVKKMQTMHEMQKFNKVTEEIQLTNGSRAFQDRTVEWDTFPFDEVSERDTWIYVYMEDAYGDGWNGNQLCVAELGQCLSLIHI